MDTHGGYTMHEPLSRGPEMNAPTKLIVFALLLAATFAAAWGAGAAWAPDDDMGHAAVPDREAHR